MTRSAFHNPMKPFEQRYPIQMKNNESQSLKRQHEDELTASSTVTPSSLQSHATSMSNPYPLHDVLDRKVEQSARLRIIDLAERCPPVRSRRPGMQEEDNESTIAPRKVSYKRISPDVLPVKTCIVNVQQEQQRLRCLRGARLLTRPWNRRPVRPARSVTR